MDPITQQGAGYVLTAFGGLIVGKLFDYLGARLNTRVADLEKAHKLCEEDRARDKVLLLAHDAKDRRELEAKIAALQSQVDAHTKRSDDTAEHAPAAK